MTPEQVKNVRQGQTLWTYNDFGKVIKIVAGHNGSGGVAYNGGCEICTNRVDSVWDWPYGNGYRRVKTETTFTTLEDAKLFALNQKIKEIQANVGRYHLESSRALAFAHVCQKKHSYL